MSNVASMVFAEQPLPCYLVESYRPGLDEDQLSKIIADVDRSSASVRAEGSPVRCVLTLAVPTDEVVFAVFAADSSDVVNVVCRRAGIPVARLSPAVADPSCAQKL